MHRSWLRSVVLVGLAVAIAASALAAVRAQTSTPTLEGTTTCTAVVYWFPDVIARIARKGQAATSPILTLYSGELFAQTVTVTRGTELRTVSLPPHQRVAVDLSRGRDEDTAIEVAGEGKLAADLKIWTGGSAIESHGLPLCR